VTFFNETPRKQSVYWYTSGETQNIKSSCNYLSLEHGAKCERRPSGVVDAWQMIVHQRTLVIVLAGCRQVVDVSSHAVRRRERDDGHSRCVGVDGKIGQQFLDKLELVVEVGCADAGAFVDEEDQLYFTVGRASQRFYMSLQNTAEYVYLPVKSCQIDR